MSSYRKRSPKTTTTTTTRTKILRHDAKTRSATDLWSSVHILYLYSYFILHNYYTSLLRIVSCIFTVKRLYTM